MCAGTDREILDGAYGEAQPGRDPLVLGHEALGSVVEAPEESGLRPGDLVVPIVRHPDHVPCEHCAVGEWDMCRNDRNTEHGIRALDRFARDRFRTQPTHAVRVDRALVLAAVLMELASIVAKAWNQIERIGGRSHWTPRRVLVGVVCLTGVSSCHRLLRVDAGALNNQLVLENNVVFGSVNANRLHYELAAEALAQADRSWLNRLITRRVPLERWHDAYESSPDDVKTMLQFGNPIQD